MKETPRRVILTGSNGFTGQKVAELLVKIPGVSLLGVSRGPDRSSVAGKFRYEEADLLDFDRVKQIFDDFEPTDVIHTAAMTQVDLCEEQKDLCWKINVEMVDCIASQCRKHNTRMLHLSTDFIFYGEDSSFYKAGPYKETDKPFPRNYYGKIKLVSESLLSHRRISLAVLRTVLLYGYAPNTSRSNFVRWVKESLENNTPIRVVGDQYRTPTWVDDFAQGIVNCLLRDKTGTYHLSGEEMMSIADLAYRVADAWKLDKSLISTVTTKELNQVASRPMKTGFIIDKAKHELGYSPHSLEEGLSKMNIQMKGN